MKPLLPTLRERLRHLPRRSYALTKWRLLRRMDRDREDPIVVFCMSKTASSAIVRAVQHCLHRPVYKVHLLTPVAVARVEAQYRRTDPTARPRHILHASHLLRRPPTTEHPWTVVTIVREPIGRSASDFFQSGARLGRLGDAPTTIAAFVRFATAQGIPRTIAWFDRELRVSLGINVYEHPFDPATGYATIETPSVRLLILRQESLDVAPRAIGHFLGLPEPLALTRENDAARKPYSDLYDTVLQEARLAASTLDLAYTSRFAKHFYSPAELDGFRTRWGAPSPDHQQP